MLKPRSGNAVGASGDAASVKAAARWRWLGIDPAAGLEASRSPTTSAQRDLATALMLLHLPGFGAWSKASLDPQLVKRLGGYTPNERRTATALLVHILLTEAEPQAAGGQIQPDYGDGDNKPRSS